MTPEDVSDLVSALRAFVRPLDLLNEETTVILRRRGFETAFNAALLRPETEPRPDAFAYVAFSIGEIVRGELHPAWPFSADGGAEEGLTVAGREVDGAIELTFASGSALWVLEVPTGTT